MSVGLLDNSVVSKEFSETEASFVLNLNLIEHRYLYSHTIDGNVVIPTVFLLEYAVVLLQQSPLVDQLELDSFAVKNIDSKRFIQIQPDMENRLYLTFSRVEDAFNIVIGCDKLSKSGKVIRTNVSAFSATLDFERTEGTEIVPVDELEPLPLPTVNRFRNKSLAVMGQLFITPNDDYRWSEEKKCLISFSDMLDTTRYYLGSSPDVELTTHVNATISGIQYLVFYAFLRDRPAWPSDVEEICFHGPLTGRIVVTQIMQGKDESHVNLTLRNQEDNSLIAEFKNYQLQEQRGR
ncbi:polyketide synthase dehydratase domain-containing protein [Vibrio nigripulchritudo]|uniref:polyketide synthase dehydratase domain-containing protein n=1 Tax=Vibrio nigripulchritudo TaxID=28173 RepID=UPI0005FA7C67|nr:polyketide synthase dehydratase domain-containing protein [Vibrio nigripulchritudo]KJY66499.1 hypothetical protein TW74_27935 [Vibrio nigripulchritudo]